MMKPPKELPESMTLRPSLITWSLVFLFGCWMLSPTLGGNDPEDLISVLCTLLGWPCVVLPPVLLWPNNTWIKFGPDGLRIRILFANIHHRWCDINGFRITTVGTRFCIEKYVTFGVGPNNAQHALPNGFGINADRLLSLMESYWKCYR